MAVEIKVALTVVWIGSLLWLFHFMVILLRRMTNFVFMMCISCCDFTSWCDTVTMSVLYPFTAIWGAAKTPSPVRLSLSVVRSSTNGLGSQRSLSVCPSVRQRHRILSNGGRGLWRDAEWCREAKKTFIADDRGWLRLHSEVHASLQSDHSCLIGQIFSLIFGHLEAPFWCELTKNNLVGQYI